MRVRSVKSISIAASELFLAPNWIGVNIKLKTRFNKKGITTKMGNCPWNAR